jgi:hypothetical protein
MLETRSKQLQFYDVVYSPDDGGYYCEVYTEHNEDLMQTEVLPTREQAEKAVKDKYPEAKLLGVF